MIPAATVSKNELMNSRMAAEILKGSVLLVHKRDVWMRLSYLREDMAALNGGSFGRTSLGI